MYEDHVFPFFIVKDYHFLFSDPRKTIIIIYIFI